MRWVDLAIWVDEHIYEDDCDQNTAYIYIWLLAYMLASKRRYFESQRDYEDFASFLAYDTFQRMTNSDKGKVKSVLNYMKSVLSFRRIAFNTQKRQKIIDPKFDDEWDSVAYVEKCKESYEASNRDLLYDGVVDIFKLTPKIVRKNIPKVFKLDKVEYENIYMSCLLSMLNKITLPNQYIDKFETKLNESSSFDEVKYYIRHLNGDVILWNLPDSMRDLIILILNKISNELVDEIKGVTNESRITDNDFKYVMTSGFVTGGSNETDY